MHYKLTISERAESHIDNILDYVVNVLKNPGAARAIIVDIEEAYSRLGYMAESYRFCNDSYLAGRGYRKIMLSRHDYLILYRVVDDEVQISGVFHMLENYARKL